MKNNPKEEIVRYQNTINSNNEDQNEDKNNINIAYDFDDGLSDLKTHDKALDTYRGLSDIDPFDDIVDHPCIRNIGDIVVKKEDSNDNNHMQVFKKKIVQNRIKVKRDDCGALNNKTTSETPSMFNLNQYKVEPYNTCIVVDKKDKDSSKDIKGQMKSKRVINTGLGTINTNVNGGVTHNNINGKQNKGNECNCNKVIINNVNNNSNNNIIIQTPKIEKLGDDYFNVNNKNYNAIYSNKNTKSDNNNDFGIDNDDGGLDCNKHCDYSYEMIRDSQDNDFSQVDKELIEVKANLNEPNKAEENKSIKSKHKAKGTFSSLQIKSNKKNSPINKIDNFNSKDIDLELASHSNQITDFQKSLYTQQIAPQTKQKKKKKRNSLNHYASFVSSPYHNNPIIEEELFNQFATQVTPRKPKRRKSTDLPIMRNQTALFNANPNQLQIDSSNNVDNDIDYDIGSNHMIGDEREIDEDVELRYLSKLSKLKKENDDLKAENQSLTEKYEQKNKDNLSQKSSYDTLSFEYDVIVTKFEELKAKCKLEDSDKVNIDQMNSELKTKGDKVIELSNKITELESIINSNEQRAIDDKNNIRELKLNHDSLRSSYLDIKNQYDVITLKIQSLNEENFSLKRELLLLKTNHSNTNTNTNANTNNNTISDNTQSSSFNKYNSNFYSENSNFSTGNKEDIQPSTFRKRDKKSQICNTITDQDNDILQPSNNITDRIKRKNTSQNDSSGVSSLLTCGNINTNGNGGSRNNNNNNDTIAPIKRHDTSRAQLQSQSQTQLSEIASTNITGTFRKRHINPVNTNSNISILPCQTELLEKESKINHIENELFQLQSERTKYNDELNKLPEYPKQKAQIIQKKNIEIQIGELNVKINEHKRELRELTKAPY